LKSFFYPFSIDDSYEKINRILSTMTQIAKKDNNELFGVTQYTNCFEVWCPYTVFHHKNEYPIDELDIDKIEIWFFEGQVSYIECVICGEGNDCSAFRRQGLYNSVVYTIDSFCNINPYEFIFYDRICKWISQDGYGLEMHKNTDYSTSTRNNCEIYKHNDRMRIKLRLDSDTSIY